MGSSCCQAKEEDLKGLVKKQKKVLWAVLIINAVMFFVEYFWGIYSSSQALMADSLDMMGDALAYGSTLFVIGGSLTAKAKSSMFKSIIMIVTGLTVLGKTLYQFFVLAAPKEQVMLIVAIIALVMNGLCLYLLTKHKDDDINFKSVWVCSRNDIFANSSVILAAVLVWFGWGPYPDLIIGLLIALLFMNSAVGLLKESWEVAFERK